MGTSRNWFKLIHRKFVRPSTRDIVVVTNTSPNPHEEIADAFQDPNTAAATPKKKQALTKQDIAAIKIQAFFRGHLARQAFRALRSLVKLQALVRGVCVRRQSRIALHCMHSLVRLQVSVRARQLLSRSGDGVEILYSDLYV
ncbi:hypothetical protein FNV43_RR18649 [Rhamnella rubrinervis]|uniref:Uncharacterized protein n=1 Tax=Rhamnella rubrinervis TaxID=2594499 RepID=A0A8K0GY38_9ROSA|nr:hypothetical protein FNV43_RR18649 [Rhamnella rubrinervis]